VSIDILFSVLCSLFSYAESGGAMKLASFEVSTLMGPQTRTGGLDAQGRVVDLAAAYRLKLLSDGLPERAAARISAALLPGDMVELIEGGERSLEAARTAIDWATRYADESAIGGAVITFDMGNLAMLPPVPRPPLLRDFMGFETHLKNIYPRLGREIPPEWYHLPVYYKGNPGSLATHGDDIPMPPYAEEVDFEFELAFVMCLQLSNPFTKRVNDDELSIFVFKEPMLPTIASGLTADSCTNLVNRTLSSIRKP
jgi:hypothetical protein